MSSEGRRLKMKDLEAATGVGRETIRFYIQSGRRHNDERQPDDPRDEAARAPSPHGPPKLVW